MDTIEFTGVPSSLRWVLSLLLLLLPAMSFLCPYASLTYSIVLTIVHFDGTSTLSLHIGDLRRERYFDCSGQWIRLELRSGQLAQWTAEQAAGQRIGRLQRWAVPTYLKNKGGELLDCWTAPCMSGRFYTKPQE
jgi:hypothetical protein